MARPYVPDAGEVSRFSKGRTPRPCPEWATCESTRQPRLSIFPYVSVHLFHAEQSLPMVGSIAGRSYANDLTCI
jgi:hypothetical protein